MTPEQIIAEVEQYGPEVLQQVLDAVLPQQEATFLVKLAEVLAGLIEGKSEAQQLKDQADADDAALDVAENKALGK